MKSEIKGSVLFLKRNMTVNKFGTHIFDKCDDGDTSLKIVNIAEVKLFYVVVLPFVGRHNPAEKNLVLLGDGLRTSYRYPFESGTILNGEYPKKDISLLINGKTGKLEGREIKKNDLIAFRRAEGSTLTEFYGELLIKCQVQVET